MLLASTAFNIISTDGGNFIRGVHNDFFSIFNLLVAVLIFEFIKKINFDNLPKIAKKSIITISNLSLGIYLTSSIIDDFIFFRYFDGNVLCNFSEYFKLIPIVFLISTLLSAILNFIYKIIDKYIIKKILIKNTF